MAASLFGLFVAFADSSAQQQYYLPPTFPSIPARPTLGPETHQVYPDRIVEVSTGQTHFPTGGDLWFILVTCLDTYAKPPAYPNPVIGVYGDIAANVGTQNQRMQFGGGDAGSKPYRADWGASTPMTFSVIGMTPDAKITGFTFRNDLSGTPWGGIADARFEGLIIEAQGDSGIRTDSTNVHSGIARIYDCVFTGDDEQIGNPQIYFGFGYKWGVRGHGPMRWDFRDCYFNAVEEHCIYVDSPQGDSYMEGITQIESRRTAIQVVNRAFDCPIPPNHQACLDAYENGVTLPRPSGFGKLLIYGVTINQLRNDGGSGVTVVGHKDDVWIKNVAHVNTANTQHGSVVVWCDDGVQSGAHIWTHAGSGAEYAVKRAVLKTITVNATQDRDPVKLSAIGKLEIVSPWSITSNRTAFVLDSTADEGNFNNALVVLNGVVQRYTGTVENRDPVFWWTGATNLSAYSGFHGTGAKISEDGVTLNDAQIDVRWPFPGQHN